jgi:hypothetical protein
MSAGQTHTLGKQGLGFVGGVELLAQKRGPEAV